MSPSRPLRLAAASFAVTALLASAACSGGGKPKKSSAPTPTTPTTPATSSAPSTPAAPPPINPFTGIGSVPKSPVISVKIDDTAPGRPQVGINQADIVYIEAVEGGLTRLAAIYGTTKPTSVGYVRSTRPSDPDLLLQFGKITAAYSGGAHDSIPLLRRSGIKSWSNDSGAGYYSRVSRGASSYINLVLDVAKVARKTKTAAPRNIGWTFQTADTGLPALKGTDVRTVVRGSNSAGTPVEFRYSATLRKYVRYINGQRQVDSKGRPVTATNVIVQFCRVVPHPQDTDVNGNPSQFTYTVGSGSVSVFRHGKRVNGHWSRTRLNGGTRLTMANGKPLPLVPGNTWVVLATNGTPVQG